MFPSLQITSTDQQIFIVGNQTAVDSAEINRVLVMDGINVQGLTYITENMEDYFIERMGGKHD